MQHKYGICIACLFLPHETQEIKKKVGSFTVAVVKHSWHFDMLLYVD